MDFRPSSSETAQLAGRVIGIAASQAAFAVTALRREQHGAPCAWTLGAYGRGEVSVDFESLEVSDDGADRPTRILVTAALLWLPTSMRARRAEIDIVSTRTSETTVTLSVCGGAEVKASGDEASWIRLGAALVDELCEELLYHSIAAPCDGRAAA